MHPRAAADCGLVEFGRSRSLSQELFRPRQLLQAFVRDGGSHPVIPAQRVVTIESRGLQCRGIDSRLLCIHAVAEGPEFARSRRELLRIRYEHAAFTR